MGKLRHTGMEQSRLLGCPMCLTWKKAAGHAESHRQRPRKQSLVGPLGRSWPVPQLLSCLGLFSHRHLQCQPFCFDRKGRG